MLRLSKQFNLNCSTEAFETGFLWKLALKIFKDFEQDLVVFLSVTVSIKGFLYLQEV